MGGFYPINPEQWAIRQNNAGQICYKCIYTVNKDIFAQLNFHALGDILAWLNFHAHTS